MLITRHEFDDRLRAGTLRLAHIGMSNIGKTRRARELINEAGFAGVTIDDEIEQLIATELPECSISGVAAWMGFPYDERYATNAARYLTLEDTATRAITPPTDRNFVLDTTGSVIYLPADVHDRLRRDYLIIHIAASEARRATLIERYFTNPKPVIWGDAYQPEPGEDPTDALRRCYPELLRYRLGQYEGLADVTVPSPAGTDHQMTAEEFLAQVREALPT